MADDGGDEPAADAGEPGVVNLVMSATGLGNSEAAALLEMSRGNPELAVARAHGQRRQRERAEERAVAADGDATLQRIRRCPGPPPPPRMLEQRSLS